ncbi:class I SAM-dependent methyltransferase [uncultured Winogradskyella sp.]|jgi:2-polyprenyl-3-methyl-5-hydroxy-6-metoxy-1,4-benzoquinol methylase|uniref:class I SAM-dependent methyltransferase n=1 Tax=uncultured Winogradskyella sp. TaxID=395353 RepID=UPI0025DEBB70|nr:class I SAM-dependent methyltransferase [uncultured Winogradskyella sp.]
MNKFKYSKRKFKSTFKTILEYDDSYEIGEAALPAYSHQNPIIDWLFWKRIKIALKFAKVKKTQQRILDFGCGSGVLSYMLALDEHLITSCDIEFGPFNKVRQIIDFPDNINFIQGDILNMNFKEASFDIIYALDVLEHIDDLEPYVTLFSELLVPGGTVIISGPTENIFYKIGRKIAGKRFSGDYHVTNISFIKNVFSLQMNVKTIKKIQFPVFLFEIFGAQNK